MTDRPSDELVARMVELVRMISTTSIFSISPVHFAPLAGQARAIVAELPQPVDPDLEEMRELCARGRQENGWEEISAIYLDGGYDHVLTDALAAIKRGRELERGAR